MTSRCHGGLPLHHQRAQGVRTHLEEGGVPRWRGLEGEPRVLQLLQNY